MKTKFSIIVPSYNSGTFLEKTLVSILTERSKGSNLELIVVDGGSTDATPEILDRYKMDIDCLVVEPDTGPANAINKGLALATGDILAWLNADDLYMQGALQRVEECVKKEKTASFYFGRYTIIDEQGSEMRTVIARFKELFYPVNSLFAYQCINYIGQPASFFTKEAYAKVGALREDMIAAWDYDFLLRLWHVGKAKKVPGAPLAAFRCHPQSISSQNFSVQFKEEYDVAVKDCGVFSVQSLLHFFVRWGIVGVYSVMAALRNRKSKGNEQCD